MKGNSGVNVILKDPAENPCCPHGPTLLLSKQKKGKMKKFFVCAAQRDRKFCAFYHTEGAQNMSEGISDVWKQKVLDFKKGIDHRKLFLLSNEVKLLKLSERIFCSTCSLFILNDYSEHENHKLIREISDYQFMTPTEILSPAEIDKSTAQYWFSKSTVEDIVQIFKSLEYRNVICIGAPRIHEYIKKNCENMKSILLDFDKRFHSFFSPLEFCWYNLFNNHFYFDDAKAVFSDFLQEDNGNNMVIITDPPFGGRTEPISFTLQQINETYKRLNNRNDNVPVFWIYPYFMEPHICHSDSSFSMLDYKVEYENHVAFGNGPKARKYGSPVRIFTTSNPSLIKLPENKGYKYCEKCSRWVLNENNHCDICKECPSKNGQTYVHCMICRRCVKPTWVHCKTCRKCTQASHHCEGTKYTKPCDYCNSYWHKRNDCQNKNSKNKSKKRKAAAAKVKEKKFKKAKRDEIETQTQDSLVDSTD